MGWIYVGESFCTHYVDAETGRPIHSKTLATGRRGYTTKLREEGRIEARRERKFKYVLPLDPALRPALEAEALPYPKAEDVVS